MTSIRKEEIYREYYDKIFGYVLFRINDRNATEDIVSDVFLKVYENIDSFDETKASLSTWIYSITQNTLKDHYRTFKTFDEIPETQEDGTSIEDELCNAETLQALADALKTLAERERSIIILHYYYGKSFREISDKLGISYTYVKVLKAKALNILKEYLVKSKKL